jgi:Na+-driven multidrug efflux pump
MFVMLPLAWWLAFPQEMGVWGVFLGVSVASVIAGLAQTVAVEIYAARGVLRASPEAAH